MLLRKIEELQCNTQKELQKQQYNIQTYIEKVKCESKTPTKDEIMSLVQEQINNFKWQQISEENRCNIRKIQEDLVSQAETIREHNNLL